MKIEQTHNTPYVFLDKQNCKLTLKGRSYPENAIRFYKPINEEILKCSEDIKNSIITVEVLVEILNSTSSKSIHKIFKDLYDLSNKTIINWYCEEDDEDMIEQAHAYKSSFDKFNFNIVKVPDMREL